MNSYHKNLWCLQGYLLRREQRHLEEHSVFKVVIVGNEVDLETLASLNFDFIFIETLWLVWLLLRFQNGWKIYICMYINVWFFFMSVLLFL